MKIAFHLRDRDVSCIVTFLSEILNVFNTISLKEFFWEMETFFIKLKYRFLVGSSKIENATFLYKIDSRTHPRRVFPRRTLPRPDISPTRHIPDGHFPDQTYPRRTFPRPDKCPTDIFLSRCIPQRTFPRPVKYLR